MTDHQPHHCFLCRRSIHHKPEVAGKVLPSASVDWSSGTSAPDRSSLQLHQDGSSRALLLELSRYARAAELPRATSSAPPPLGPDCADSWLWRDDLRQAHWF